MPARRYIESHLAWCSQSQKSRLGRSRLIESFGRIGLDKPTLWSEPSPWARGNRTMVFKCQTSMRPGTFRRPSTFLCHRAMSSSAREGGDCRNDWVRDQTTSNLREAPQLGYCRYQRMRMYKKRTLTCHPIHFARSRTCSRGGFPQIRHGEAVAHSVANPGND